jgi:hypothetical protein
VTEVGLVRTEYAFRTIPYRSRIAFDLAYSTGLNGFGIALETDHRYESSALHVLSETLMSQLEVGRFLGFGNDSPDLDDVFADVRQTQWAFHPAVAYAIGPASDVSLGPTVQLTLTDENPRRLVSDVRPYGYPRFGQAGLQLRFNYDPRQDATATSGGPLAGISSGAPWKSGVFAEVTSSVYPAMWDVTSAYANVAAVAVAHIALPILTTPLLAFRAGAEKMWGDFPYFDAAFLGGGRSLRTFSRQRFAGDAALHGSAELRVPIAAFPLILPLNVGALGFVETGRVFVDGESPGGWHTGVAGGLWLGVLNPGTSLTVMFTNQKERRWLFGLGFDY